MGIFYNKTTFKVHRDAQEIPVKAKVDVLVCGGGPAGIGAALGAAKGEVSVMIIEKNNCLGGTRNHWTCDNICWEFYFFG